LLAWRRADRMTSDFVPTLNEHGLFVHVGAQRTIEAFVRENQVGQYPMYLVGMALPEHRCGPAIAALLTLPDGGVLHACARSLGKKQKVNGLLEFDVDHLDTDGLQRYRRIFYDEYGGFSLPCLESSPTAAAESMLLSSWLGLRFGPEVAPSPQGPPDAFPSDWTDIVYYSQKAVGCTAEGFAPGAGAIVRLEIPDTLKRAMQLAKSTELDWLGEWEYRLAREVHSQIPGLVTEAWAMRLVSPRASVALLRTVAELVADSLGAHDGRSFNERLERLEKRWAEEPLDTSPSGRRESARRAAVLSCFHTVRDLGNQIHAESVVTPTDVDLAHNSNRRLLEAVLRAGPLDQCGPT
jgi:hypothetical protein